LGLAALTQPAQLIASRGDFHFPVGNMPKDFARTERVAEQMQRELAELLQMEVRDPRVRLVTLTGVEVARDYSHAKVYYTTLEGASEKVQQGLDHACSFLRNRLFHNMKLRVTPQLHFVYDESVERGARLSQLIDQAVKGESS
jgi:ribosome-binding factor A